MAKTEKDRAERLAAALRENLRRRKAQAREADVTAAKAGVSGSGGKDGGQAS